MHMLFDIASLVFLCLYKITKVSIFSRSTYYLLVIAFGIADSVVQQSSDKLNKIIVCVCSHVRGFTCVCWEQVPVGSKR